MLDELLDLFERDRKPGAARPAGGLRGRLSRLFGGGAAHDDDDRREAESRRYRDDDDDDDRRAAETRRYRDDDDDDDRRAAHAGGRKRERDFFDFGDD